MKLRRSNGNTPIHTLNLTTHTCCGCCRYELAAEAGDVYSEYNAGVLLAGRKEIPPDIDRAIEYLSRASKQGHKGASYHLAFLYVLSLPLSSPPPPPKIFPWKLSQ